MKFPDFENGIVKLLSDDEDKLTRDEKKCLKQFKKIFNPVENPIIGESSVRKAFIDSPRKEDISQYESVAWIPGTSCRVERLFSQAKHYLTDHRKSLKNETLEMLIFLKENSDLWNPQTFENILIKESQIELDNEEKKEDNDMSIELLTEESDENEI